jgi:hypothetical protein
MRGTRDEGGSAAAPRSGSRSSRRPRPTAVASGLALIATGAVLVTLLVGGGQRLVQARVIGIGGTAQLRLSGERGELIVKGLPPPPSGDAYEVWLEPTHSPPLPTQLLFSPGPAGRADLTLPGSLRGISQVLVTLEPSGGSLAPTHAPMIVVSLG